MQLQTSIPLSETKKLILRDVQDKTQLTFYCEEHDISVAFNNAKFVAFRRLMHRLGVAVNDRYYGLESQETQLMADSSSVVSVCGYGEFVCVKLKNADEAVTLNASEWFHLQNVIHQATKLFYKRFLYPNPTL